MLGAIAGDIIGSVYEFYPTKNKDFPLFSKNSRFTDDTVLSVAIADAILTQSEYVLKIKEYARKYPHAGYGGNFKKWANSDSLEGYNSWGNGSAMRVSAVGFAFNDLNIVLTEALKTASVTHNHPEGIKGAQATATAIVLARKGKTKAEIKSYLENTFNYNLGQTLAEIRPYYRFDVSCQGSVPQAIICFLEAENYEDAVRNAVSLGGDSDTQACIAGGIAEAFYSGIPENIVSNALNYLSADLKEVVENFRSQYL